MNPIHTLVEKIDAQELWEKTITLDRNQYLKVRGSTDTNIYFIVSGILRIFLIEANEECTIRFGYQNNLITAMDSFLSGSSSAYYIQALKKTTVKVMHKAKFDALIDASDDNKKLWISILEIVVLQQLDRERDLLTSSPLERYNNVLKRSPQLFQEVPGKYIASYLRMTPETLSRLKKN